MKFNIDKHIALCNEVHILNKIIKHFINWREGTGPGMLPFILKKKKIVLKMLCQYFWYIFVI